jgi:AraC-like DNA-binding protein
MRLAQRSLRDEKTSIFELGKSLGYSSESAFSNAFKRVTGTAPRNYRYAARQPPAPRPVDEARAA